MLMTWAQLKKSKKRVKRLWHRASYLPNRIWWWVRHRTTNRFYVVKLIDETRLSRH